MGPFCTPICRDTRPCGRPYCTYNIEGERGERSFFRRFRNNTQREEGDLFARYFQNNFVGHQEEQGEGRGLFQTYFQRNRRGGRGDRHQPPHFVNNIGGGGRHGMYFDSNVGGEGRGHHQPYFVNNIIGDAGGTGDGASGVGSGVPIYQTTVGPGDVLFLRPN
ncbi:uncharacterized protein LOC109824179 [Asparagus officinalis]|uniref:uncharacterized protein LOC109824179 n=1 Tax=Asparagus officinalis TaxID=4686 RepID=UPI00098DF747|nr:uncharacterized protein LOC109824179 [Asparagus officinalis]